jgi:Putative peptidoglycan binding domain/CHAP domain
MSVTTGPLTYSTVKARLTGKVGVHEDPARSNRQQFGLWYGWNGVPWCAIFQSWGFNGGVQQMGGKHASCSALKRTFQAAGRYGSTPKVGALAIFNGAVHVEMVVGVFPDYLLTVGGNTSRADGTNPWGGEVALKKRSRASIEGYCYPVYKAAPPKPSTFKVGPTLREGSAGVPVKRLQQGLNAIRNAKLVTDGRFGPKTLAAVKAYQKAEKIAVDGRVGPTTQRHLFVDKVKIY